MLYLDQAIITRWNAVGLNTSIGTLWADRVPELQSLPYATLDNIGDSKSGQTVASRYQKAIVQIQVYDATKELAGAWCEQIEPNFLNANNAAVNPLVIVGNGTDFILSCIGTGPYILTELSDAVWQGTLTFTIEYRRAGLLQTTKY